MTFEEALKILEKEVFGIRFKKFDKPLKFEEKLWIRNEKPEVLEALHIVAKNGIGVSVPETTLRIRRLIIKKMKAGEGEPTPVSGTPLSAVEGIKLKRKDNQNTSEKPALKESATQFNDALLDEQAKKIAELTKENERLERVSKTTTDEFNKLYYRMITKSDKIEALGKEIAKLNGIIHEKKKVCCELVAENTDLKEHLAESKESAKNFASLLSDAYDELRELKKKYADKVVDEINAQALKSAESALAWKEKVIAEKDMALAYYEKKIAEKDEVIDNLRKELKAQKGLVNHISKKYDGAKINLNLRMKECEKLKEALEEKTNLVEMVRKGSKEYREYGIEAVKMIRKMAKVIVSYKPVVSLKDFKEYRRLANGYSFNPQLFDFSEEEEKKLSLIRDDSVGAVTNQKNYSPFKDTHPTEESPEEVELDEILELFVRL